MGRGVAGFLCLGGEGVAFLLCVCVLHLSLDEKGFINKV